MSETLVNPRILLGQLARELPPELHDQVFLAGSLAAACHHAARLSGGGVRATAERVFVDVIEPVEAVGRAAGG